MAADIQLDEASTKEEIAAFVDELHAERTAEKAPPEKKSDAQIVNEIPDVAPEKPAKATKTKKAPVAEALPGEGDETAEAPVADAGKKAKGEISAKADPDDRAWLDDGLRKQIAGYGIDEAELTDFDSREDVERALRLIDKRALAVGQKALADGEAPNPRDAQGRFTKTETTKEPEAAKPAEPAAKPSYEIKLSKDKYEDDIVDELTGMRDHYEARLAALEAKTQEAEAQAEGDRFDVAVDGLEMPTLFGNTGSESAEELKRREDLLLQCRALQHGLQQLTGKSPDIESLVLSQAKAAFADEFDKQTIKSRTIRIAKQSDKRQGGGATRPTDAPESGREYAARRFRELSGA